MSENTLVTGGAGFIGSNFVRLACRQVPGKIVILDALTYAGNLDSLADVLDRPNLHFVKGNICDRELVTKLFREHSIGQVVNFAAESHVDRSILAAQPFLQTNVIGTSVLLEVARHFWQTEPGGRNLFLQISTDEVLGSLGPDAPPFSEASPYRPSSPYAATKASADHLAMAWHRTYGVPVIISRCSNNYGPWQFPEKLIPLMILNAMEGKELPVYGDGRHVRDWLYVEDHCEALLTILRAGKVGESYNIGGQCERANIDVVRQICGIVDQVCGRPKGATARLIQHVADRPGHDRRYAMDITRIERSLGWRPRHSLDATLRDVVQWYLDRKAWVDRIRDGQYMGYYERQYGSRPKVGAVRLTAN